MTQSDVVFFIVTELGEAELAAGAPFSSLIVEYGVGPVFTRARVEGLPGATPAFKKILQRLYAYVPPVGLSPDAFVAALGVLHRERDLFQFIWLQPKLASQPTGSHLQGYLSPPILPIASTTNYSTIPWGVGCTALPDEVECQGEGATIWIVERGWHHSKNSDPYTVDGLPSPEPNLVFGICSTAEVDRNHGTSDLSVIAMVRGDAKYGWGVAPKATIKLVATGAVSSAIHSIYDRILDVAAAAKVGDILLIEEQFRATYGGSASDQRDCCVDVCPLMRLLLRYAVRRGVVPVLPAGNGDGDLALMSIPMTTSKMVFLWKVLASNIDVVNPMYWVKLTKLPSWPVAGLIRVGGVEVPGIKRTQSNYGDSVDLFSWFSQVYALRVDRLNNVPFTTSTKHGGTSAAAAIVAGAAAVAQAMQFKKTGTRRRSLAMRNLLVYGGTVSDNPAFDQVGVMPNLGKIKLAIDNNLV